MALVVAASKPTSAKTWAATSRSKSIRRKPRACRRRVVRVVVGRVTTPSLVDNASNSSYCGRMRALTHISAAATPDYALRVPSHVQLLLGTGVIGGLVGIGLLGAAPTLPALFGYLLLAAGVLSASFALSLSIITSPGLRERARRQMVNAVAWRGDERVLDVGCGNGFLLIETAK